MYVSEICAEGIFVTFLWWLKNVKSRSKIAPLSNERHFEIWFPKKRTITFFWSKLSKLHKKDPILYVATTFSLKQGETRTSHGPIPHPLIASQLGVCNCVYGCNVSEEEQNTLSNARHIVIRKRNLKSFFSVLFCLFCFLFLFLFFQIFYFSICFLFLLIFNFNICFFFLFHFVF